MCQGMRTCLCRAARSSVCMFVNLMFVQNETFWLKYFVTRQCQVCTAGVGCVAFCSAPAAVLARRYPRDFERPGPRPSELAERK